MAFVAPSRSWGLILRVALAGRSGIWCDEAQFLFVVRMPSIAAMLDFLWHHESHPPFFYLLMRAWLGLFGDSEAAALALPVILGVVLIPVVYWVGDRVFSRRTGLIAAAFVAVVAGARPLLGMVRPYSLLPLLALLSVYWVVGRAERGEARPWVAHVIATLAMLLTHNWAWMVLGAEWILSSCGWFGMHEWTQLCPIRSWSLAQGLVLLAYALGSRPFSIRPSMQVTGRDHCTCSW